MAEFKIIFHEGESYTVEDLSSYHIENLKEVAIVKDVIRIHAIPLIAN